MTKIFHHGDTVLVKDQLVTDGEWQKAVVRDHNSYYEMRFLDSDKKFNIAKNDIIACNIPIIKVDSNFEQKCDNCRYSVNDPVSAPCYKCLGSYSYWEPCNSLKNKNKLVGNDITAFSIDEGPFHNQSHSDNIDTLRYCVNDIKALAALQEDLNKKENKNMKNQQKRRNRNLFAIKDGTKFRKLDEIKFNGPATIIKWKPTFSQELRNIKGDKTVVVCKEPDKLDKTTGFLLAVLKDLLDNKSYGNLLEKIDEINKEN